MFEEVHNGDKSPDNEDVEGVSLWMKKATNVMMMMMKVAASYKKKGDINVGDEYSYVTKFDNSCNSSSTMQNLHILVYVSHTNIFSCQIKIENELLKIILPIFIFVSIIKTLKQWNIFINIMLYFQ